MLRLAYGTYTLKREKELGEEGKRIVGKMHEDLFEECKRNYAERRKAMKIVDQLRLLRR